MYQSNTQKSWKYVQVEENFVGSTCLRMYGWVCGNQVEDGRDGGKGIGCVLRKREGARFEEIEERSGRRKVRWDQGLPTV